MLAKMVVVRDEMGQPFPGIGQVSGLYSAPKLIIDRFPETLTFTHGLRMMGASYDMFDALLFEQFLKFTPASPGKVLPALVGQDLQGLAKARDAFLIGLYQCICSGMAEKAPGDDVAAEIVQENDQVSPHTLPVQDKAGEVTLPKLVGTTPLKPAGEMSFPRTGRRRSERKAAGMVEDLLDASGTHFESPKTL